jgi:tRNA(Ile)-lysidine synthase
VRQRVLPVLEQELGPGVAAALARTADQLREDAAALDEIARRVHARVVSQGAVDCGFAGTYPGAVVLRVVRTAAVEAGCPPSELFRVHVLALVGLVEGPEGVVRHKQVQLPGHVTAYREGDLLKFRPTAVAG